jgi:hypothetical protein
LSVEKAKAGTAGRGEAEKRIGPVPDSKNLLSMERAHVFGFSVLAECRTILSSGLQPDENP